MYIFFPLLRSRNRFEYNIPRNCSTFFRLYRSQAVSVVFSLVLAVSQCAPGRFGTVDQYRPAFDSEDSGDHSDADEYDSSDSPADSWTDSDDVLGAPVGSEKPQDYTEEIATNDEHTTPVNRHRSESQTITQQPSEDDASTITHEPTTDSQTTQVAQ